MILLYTCIINVFNICIFTPEAVYVGLGLYIWVIYYNISIYLFVCLFYYFSMYISFLCKFEIRLNTF